MKERPDPDPIPGGGDGARGRRRRDFRPGNAGSAAIVALAAALQDRGARPGRVLAAQVGLAGSLASLRAAARHLGSPLLPLAPYRGPAERGALIAATDPALVLEEMPASGRPALPGRTRPYPWRDRDIRLIVPTSGSEGLPKGVMLSHGALRAGAAAACGLLDFRSGDRWLCCLPLHHIAGLAILERAEAVGGEVLLHHGFDPVRVWADLASRDVSHLSLVPAMLEALLAVADRPVPAKLRCLLLGGGPASPVLVRRGLEAGWPLCLSYGLTEAGSQVATCCASGPDWSAGEVGRPLPHLKLRVEAGCGGSGPLLLRGAGLMSGYANPDLTPGDGLTNGWFRSGDLGRLDRCGRLTVLGRHDDVLVTGGENVHPSLVEARLREHPDILDVGIGARPDPRWGQRLVAVVAGPIRPEALMSWARAHLPGHRRPREVIRVDALPRSRFGKLERRALQALIDASPSS